MISKTDLLNKLAQLGFNLDHEGPETTTLQNESGRRLLITMLDDNWLVMYNNVSVVFNDATIDSYSLKLTGRDKKLVAVIYTDDM